LLRAGLVRVLEEAGEESWPPSATPLHWSMPSRASHGRGNPTSESAGHDRRRLRAAIELRTADRIQRSSSSPSTWSSVRERAPGDGLGRLGYLLKERVADVGQFVEAVRRVAAGGTALDPEVIAQLVARSNRRDRSHGSRRASEGCSVSWQKGAATRPSPACSLSATCGRKAREQHLHKLDLPPNEPDDRRVLAVLRWLGA